MLSIIKAGTGISKDVKNSPRFAEENSKMANRVLSGKINQIDENKIEKKNLPLYFSGLFGI